MPKIPGDSFALFYQTAGDGASVVFVHGGFASLRGVLDVAEEEAETWDWSREWDFARRFRFTWYDRRGCYHSTRPADGDYSLEAQARDLETLLDHLQVPATHLIGSSAGGPISVFFAATRPHRVSSLVLAGTGLDLFPRGESVSELLRRQVALLTQEGPQAGYARRPPGVEDTLDVLWEREEAEARGELAAYLDELLQFGTRARALPETTRVGWYAAELRNIQAYLDLDLGAYAARVTVPTLVLHGDNDRMVPPSWGEALARAIPSARYELIAGGPHGVIHRSDDGRRRAIAFIAATQS